MGNNSATEKHIYFGYVLPIYWEKKIKLDMLQQMVWFVRHLFQYLSLLIVISCYQHTTRNTQPLLFLPRYILVHIFMRISWRTRICKNIPRPWRPWPTGEMVYCECGTTNKKQGEYLEAGGEGVVGGSSLKIFTELRVGRPTFLHMYRIHDSRVSIWYLYLR